MEKDKKIEQINNKIVRLNEIVNFVREKMKKEQKKNNAFYM